MDLKDTFSQWECIPILYSCIFNYTNNFQVVLDLIYHLFLVSFIFGLFLSTLEDLTKYMYFLSPPTSRKFVDVAPA